MQAPYKGQKASNVVRLLFYWNMSSFSFTIIEFSLDISFRVVMQHTSPLVKGRKREITYTELTYNCGVSHFLTSSPFHFFTFKLLSNCYFFNV